MSLVPDLNQNQSARLPQLSQGTTSVSNNAAFRASLVRSAANVPRGKQTWEQVVEDTLIKTGAVAVNSSLQVLKLPASNVPKALVGLGKLASAIARAIV